MTFEEDLIKRRIDVAAFAAGDPEKFAAWRLLYQQVHPNTFYTSVKMIINEVRRRFWLVEAPKPAVTPAAATAKPVVRRATAPAPNSAFAIPNEPSPSVDRTPEPAPRARAVIRRPAPTASVPSEAEEPVKANAIIPENNIAGPGNEAIPPATSSPGRARPVFRRPSTEPITNTSSENKTEPANEAATASETSTTSAETPKSPRPRPVIQKPTIPTTSTTADTTGYTPLEDNAALLPANNPELTEAPKSPRPRPVFKRPAPVAPDVPAAEPAAEPQPENNPAPAPAAPATEVSRFPRPRPVFKRPAKSDSSNSEPTV